mgnify:FL=1
MLLTLAPPVKIQFNNTMLKFYMEPRVTESDSIYMHIVEKEEGLLYSSNRAGSDVLCQIFHHGLCSK